MGASGQVPSHVFCSFSGGSRVATTHSGAPSARRTAVIGQLNAVSPLWDPLFPLEIFPKIRQNRSVTLSIIPDQV